MVQRKVLNFVTFSKTDILKKLFTLQDNSRIETSLPCLISDLHKLKARLETSQRDYDNGKTAAEVVERNKEILKDAHARHSGFSIGFRRCVFSDLASLSNGIVISDPESFIPTSVPDIISYRVESGYISVAMTFGDTVERDCVTFVFNFIDAT